MATKLDVDTSTISEDLEIISQENATRTLAYQEKIDKDVDNITSTLESLRAIDEECWKIYYSTNRVPVAGPAGVTVYKEVPIDPQTRLQALDKIRQNNLDRARLLKLLNPQQINVEKIVFAKTAIAVIVEQLVNVVLDFIPKEKQKEALEKLKAIDVEGIIDGK